VQARGALLVARADRSRLEPALHDTARTRRLFATIQHYRDPVADARPSNAADLRQALAAVADTTALAQDLRESASAVALDLLTSYPGAGPDDRVRRHRLAAGISAREGDDVGALDHLDAAVVLSPDHVDVRRERGEVLWRRWNTEPDTWRTRLLAELRYLQELSPSRHAELWARQAAVHEHEHDDGAALRALAVAADRDVRNVGLLVRTARCWQRLEATDNVEAVCRVARHRIAGFRRRGEMGEEEARRWLDELDGICQSTPDLS
jgi:hypothetical protein